MEINELINNAHVNAINKGFWDLEQSIIAKISIGTKLNLKEISAVMNAFTSQRLMLIVTELAEAQEALRSNDMSNFQEEIADVAIRLGDFAGGEQIDLHNEIVKKMEKNKNRPYKHGKEF